MRIKGSSKIKVKCLEEIRKKPGILRTEMYKMKLGHRQSIIVQVSYLVFEKRVVQIWDSVMRTYRLYPAGKEPKIIKSERVYHNNLSARPHPLCSYKSKIDNLGKLHGETFRMEFDEAFGILYFDLKLLSGMCDVFTITPQGN